MRAEGESTPLTNQGQERISMRRRSDIIRTVLFLSKSSNHSEKTFRKTAFRQLPPLFVSPCRNRFFKGAVYPFLHRIRKILRCLSAASRRHPLTIFRIDRPRLVRGAVSFSPHIRHLIRIPRTTSPLPAQRRWIETRRPRSSKRRRFLFRRCAQPREKQREPSAAGNGSRHGSSGQECRGRGLLRGSRAAGPWGPGRSDAIVTSYWVLSAEILPPLKLSRQAAKQVERKKKHQTHSSQRTLRQKRRL